MRLEKSERKLNFAPSLSELYAGISRLDWINAWPKFQFLVFEPGYYKTNSRALRLRELVRWYGWFRGLRAWLQTRFKSPSAVGTWMPGLWAENECPPEDLSQDFWQATKPHRADFEKLGFVSCRLAKNARTLNPQVRDSGSIFYLDATRCYFGQLIYSRHYLASRKKFVYHIVIAFTAIFDDGILACTNNRLVFDSLSQGKVIRLNSFDLPVIYQRFREELQQRRDPPRAFSNIEALREWFDARQIRNFEDRVRRRLFIRMTDNEIKAATAAMQQPPPLPRRHFRFEFWPSLIAILLLLGFFLYRHPHPATPGNTISGNTIEYQGQHFQMRLPYAEYDDYKDDPNNLNTNDLGRIEQTMESVKIPASFKDLNAFTDFAFNLQFPGYGLDIFGENGITDDGSTLDAASVEIPQASKDRVIVVRESGRSIKLVDDFIYDTSTNEVEQVQLKQGQLQYFDYKGQLLCKKPL